jgi:hypothetical protein
MGTTGWGGAVTLYVEADLSRPVSFVGPPPAPSGLTQWDDDTWDSATAQWTGYGPEWTDITQWVKAIQTSHQFSRQTNRYNTSTASITLGNTDGRFSPTNTASPYRSGGSTTIGVLRQIRIRATYTSAGGSSYSWVLFTGLIQSWDQKYPQMGFDSIVEVAAVGIESRLSQWTGLAQTAQGAGETSGARVNRILDAAGWDGPRSIDEGETTLQATTLEGDATSLLQITADSEGGYFYTRPDGTACFDGRNAQAEKGRLSNYVQFSDQASDQFTRRVVFQDIAYAYNGDLVTNIVEYQAVGGTPQRVASDTSRSLYGDRLLSRSDLLCESDTTVAHLASRQLTVFQSPELRVESVVVSPLAFENREYGSPTVGSSFFYSMAVGEIALRAGAQVTHTPIHETTQIQQLCFIEGISHSITPDNWLTTVAFSSAAAYQNVGIALFDGLYEKAGFFDVTRWGW